MILTYKVRHERDFSEELRKARTIARIAVNSPVPLTTPAVRHIGLKSVIANQVLRKYGRNKQTRKVRSVKLTIPCQGIQCDREKRTIRITSLGMEFAYRFRDDFVKINQIEVDRRFLYVSLTVKEAEPLAPEGYIGIDLNATGHAAVAAIPATGKVLKLGKKAHHIHKKYREMRRRLQRMRKYRKLKSVKNRESKIVTELNHQMSRKIVGTAFEHRCGIRLEDLSGIRDTARTTRTFRYALHSWSFCQLRKMIEYKARLLGVEVEYVNPAYTSKTCSMCGSIGDRNKKEFRCPACGHVDHADANAAFNIAKASSGTSQSFADRDAEDGSTGTPRGPMAMNAANARTP